MIFITLFISCRKEQKPIIYSGQLLLSKKNPLPVANKQIVIYQGGTAGAIGINSGATSSSASAVTDASGHFQITFRPGTSSFIIFSGASTSPLTFSSEFGDTSLFSFSRTNFPDSGNDPLLPIYIGKSIDTAIMKMNLSSDITTTDTVGLEINTISGRISKAYTGLSGNAGTTITLDTIFNEILKNYNCYQKNFINSLYAGRKYTVPAGYNTITTFGFVSPAILSADDEKKVEMHFYFMSN